MISGGDGDGSGEGCTGRRQAQSTTSDGAGTAKRTAIYKHSWGSSVTTADVGGGLLLREKRAAVETGQMLPSQS